MTLAIAYQDFRHEARVATCATCSAVLLVVLPLIALTASFPLLRLGLTLKKLRIILIPAGALLCASIPLILVAIQANRARNRAFKPYLKELQERVDRHPLGPKPRKNATKRDKELYKNRRKDFQKMVLSDLVKPYESTDFRYFLLKELANLYPKQSAKKEALEEACQKTLDS